MSACRRCTTRPGSAYLGSTAAPFIVNADPNAPNFSVPDLAPPMEVPAARLDSRRDLLNEVNRFARSAEKEANRQAAALNEFQQKAFDLMTSPATRRAFDISEEPDALREAYGRHSLGQSCLMSRRLVEAGVRCVLIDHTNWDTHYNNFDVLKNDLLPHLDSAMPTLLTDLNDRGMLDSTLVLVTGEFGRTPRVNKDAGRDHWGPSCAIAMAGGGIHGGRVVGASNERAERPATQALWSGRSCGDNLPLSWNRSANRVPYARGTARADRSQRGASNGGAVRLTLERLRQAQPLKPGTGGRRKL